MSKIHTCTVQVKTITSGRGGVNWLWLTHRNAEWTLTTIKAKRHIFRDCYIANEAREKILGNMLRTRLIPTDPTAAPKEYGGK